MTKSIVPIVTKVNPKAEDWDVDTFKGEIQEIMNANLENTLTDLNKQLVELGLEEDKIEDEDIENYANSVDLHLISHEKKLLIKEYYERQEFFNKFQESLVVVDPIDRIDPEEFPAPDLTREAYVF